MRTPQRWFDVILRLFANLRRSQRSRAERDEARGEVSDANKFKDSCIKRLRDAEDTIRRLERAVKEAERKGKEELERERLKGEEDRVGRSLAEGELVGCKRELGVLEGKVKAMGKQLSGLECEKEKVRGGKGGVVFVFVPKPDAPIFLSL